MEPSELTEKLYEIATIKQFMPAHARAFSNELGLYVQMREASGMTSLKAGGKFRSRIHLWRESRTEPWEIKKYRPGDWERLVEPTLGLANWLAMRGGITAIVRDDFDYAIKTFRATSKLELPERLDSIPDNSYLARLLEPYSDAHGDWDDNKARGLERDLLRILEGNPGFAPAWQALTKAYSHLERYKESLDALDRAINIASYEAEFRWEAAVIYLTALENAVEPDLRLGLQDQSIMDCTLDSLECGYEEARTLCIRHLTVVLNSKRPSSEPYKDISRWMLEWCVATPEHDPNERCA